MATPIYMLTHGAPRAPIPRGAEIVDNVPTFAGKVLEAVERAIIANAKAAILLCDDVVISDNALAALKKESGDVVSASVPDSNLWFMREPGPVAFCEINTVRLSRQVLDYIARNPQWAAAMPWWGLDIIATMPFDCCIIDFVVEHIGSKEPGYDAGEAHRTMLAGLDAHMPGWQTELSLKMERGARGPAWLC